MSGLRRTVLAPAAALLLPAYVSACFHYVPVADSYLPQPGATIRARLANPTPFNLGTLTVNDVTTLEGLVVETYPDSLGLWVKWLYPQGGEKYYGNSAQFYLRRASVTGLDQWRVSGAQTGIMVGLAAALVVGLSQLVSWAKARTGSNPDLPPGDKQ
jgi:hypothetical protein